MPPTGRCLSCTPRRRQGVHGGDYYGPRGVAEQRGLPKKVSMSANARDDSAALLLWERSVLLTRVQFTALEPH